jgi:hypothetical protein
MGTLIFALATDEGALMVFDSEESTATYCEGIDVEECGWRFWNDEGVALSAEFLTPNYRSGRTVGNGTYRLLPDPRLPPLASALASVFHLEPNPYFASLTEVRARLATARDAHLGG